MRVDSSQLGQPTTTLHILAQYQMRRYRCSNFHSMHESQEVHDRRRDQTCLRRRHHHQLGLLLQLLLEARVWDKVRYSVLESILIFGYVSIGVPAPFVSF